jgi:hypothetical protein
MGPLLTKRESRTQKGSPWFTTIFWSLPKEGATQIIPSGRGVAGKGGRRR